MGPPPPKDKKCFFVVVLCSVKNYIFLDTPQGILGLNKYKFWPPPPKLLKGESCFLLWISAQYNIIVSLIPHKPGFNKFLSDPRVSLGLQILKCVCLRLKINVHTYSRPSVEPARNRSWSKKTYFFLLF